MQEKTAIVRLLGDAAAVNIDLGFIPDEVEMVVDAGGTNPNIYKWNRHMADTDTTCFGLLLTGSTGVVTRMTTAATGISILEAKYQQVLLPAPNGQGFVASDVADWASDTTYSVARTVALTGTVVRPPVHNGRVYECTTATGAGTSQPTSWDVKPGETVTDGGGNVFTCREERVATKGAQGITIGETANASDKIIYVTARAVEVCRNAGDSANVAVNAFA